jgi:hypothetical protein
VTSSTATILEELSNPAVFSELDWNNQALKEVAERGKDAHPSMKYRASKTLAERGNPRVCRHGLQLINHSKAAWDFHSKVKDKVNWDLTAIIPPYVRAFVLV